MDEHLRWPLRYMLLNVSNGLAPFFELYLYYSFLVFRPQAKNK